MKVLILRTFAHPRIWESDKDHCEYEQTQLNNMILNWEPDYADQDISQFSFALGIYSAKHFTYIKKFGKSPYQHTDEENNISLLNLSKYSNMPRFSQYKNAEQIMYVYYSFKSKLWPNRNRNLMIELDNKFVEAKKSDLLIKLGSVPVTPYIPLSFVLEENVVNSILKTKGISV